MALSYIEELTRILTLRNNGESNANDEPGCVSGGVEDDEEGDDDDDDDEEEEDEEEDDEDDGDVISEDK